MLTSLKFSPSRASEASNARISSVVSASTGFAVGMPSAMAWNRYSVPSRISCRTLSGGGAVAGRVVLAEHLEAERRALGAERMKQARLVGGEPVDRRHAGADAVFQLAAHDRLEALGEFLAERSASDTPSLRRRTATAISSLYSAVKFFFSSA